MLRHRHLAACEPPVPTSGGHPLARSPHSPQTPTPTPCPADPALMSLLAQLFDDLDSRFGVTSVGADISVEEEDAIDATGGDARYGVRDLSAKDLI